MSHTKWIDAQSIAAIQSLLRDANAMSQMDRVVGAEPAGLGNMNVTLRVAIRNEGNEQHSLIVKQSRPYVAKYEFIPAPVNRIHFEAEFYRFAAETAALAKMMPRLLAWVPDQYLLVLEDLGTQSDATCIYSSGSRNHVPIWLTSLLQWLSTLHDCPTGMNGSELFANKELRALNHQHIFDLPFTDPPIIDLDNVCPGLTAASQAARSNSKLRQRCLELGEIYLSNEGTCLLHGDFYPGSWLLTDQGPFVIDPEFCFVGRREFDLGITLAHLWLSGFEHIGITRYEQFASEDQQISDTLVDEFAAVEVLRRLLGVAQLPLSLDLDQRSQLVTKSLRILLDER